MGKTIFILIIAVNVFFSCDRVKKDEKQIFMVNNSSYRVVYLTSDNYPDTISFHYNGCRAKDIACIVEPNERKDYLYYGNWESNLNKIRSRTLMFFIYNADSAAKITDKFGCGDSLRKRPDLILKRFDVTIDYLNENNWELVYP